MRCLAMVPATAFVAMALFLSMRSATTVEAASPASVEHGTSALRDGLTHLYFRGWNDQPLPVWLYVPHGIDRKTAPILFMMHGANRGAARYLSEWDHHADEGGFIVIAPEFNKDQFPSSRQYQRGNVHADSLLILRNPEVEWTFSAIEPIFDHVKGLLGSEQDCYTIYGHSGGSQFTHRFLLFKEKTRAKQFLPANAGWYTFADLTIEYPYGLQGSGVTEEQLKAALQKNVTVLLGDRDTDPNHSSLRRTKEALAQGEHRFARGQAFYENAKRNAERYGVPFGWRLGIAKGVSHSNSGMASASWKLID